MGFSFHCNMFFFFSLQKKMIFSENEDLHLQVVSLSGRHREVPVKLANVFFNETRVQRLSSH